MVRGVWQGGVCAHQSAALSIKRIAGEVGGRGQCYVLTVGSVHSNALAGLGVQGMSAGRDAAGGGGGGNYQRASLYGSHITGRKNRVHAAARFHGARRRVVWHIVKWASGVGAQPLAAQQRDQRAGRGACGRLRGSGSCLLGALQSPLPLVLGGQQGSFVLLGSSAPRQVLLHAPQLDAPAAQRRSGRRAGGWVASGWRAVAAGGRAGRRWGGGGDL